jgi:multidrug efflux pump
MNFSRFFIDKPIFAAVLSIIIFVAGLMAIFQLPISEYPDVVPPSVVVRAQYPGANPKVIAETVAAPLEEQINGVENMLYMSSQNTSDGALQLTVTFKIGTDVEQAETQVQNRVQRALPRLPEEVRQIGVTTEELAQPDHGGAPESPDGRYDDLYLRNYAVLNVKDQLARMTAWARCSCSAGDYAMRVWLDPQKVAARGLTAGDVVTPSANRTCRWRPAWSARAVEGRRVPADRQYPGPPADVEEFGDIVARPAPTARSRLLKDVARLEWVPTRMRCARC